MISYRGILAVLIGSLFVFTALQPTRFFDGAVPASVLVIVAIVGLILVGMGCLLILRVSRRSKIVRTQPGEAAQIIVFSETDAETGARSLHIKTQTGCWVAAMDLTGTPGPPLDDNLIRDGKVWFDGRSGLPIAAAVDGNQLNLILSTAEIPPERFGQKLD